MTEDAHLVLRLVEGSELFVPALAVTLTLALSELLDRFVRLDQALDLEGVLVPLSFERCNVGGRRAALDVVGA